MVKKELWKIHLFTQLILNNKHNKGAGYTMICKTDAITLLRSLKQYMSLSTALTTAIVTSFQENYGDLEMPGSITNMTKRMYE